jgi:chitinase
MPLPVDVQTANAGATVGRIEAGDTITFTFDGPVPPDLVLSGWTGAPTTVTVDADNGGGGLHTLAVLNPATLAPLPLGSVELTGNYIENTQLPGSAMTASGNTITIVLGTPSSSSVHTVNLPSTMVWTAPNGTVSESGLPDVEF